MPLTKAGHETLANFKREYGSKTGESYFYAKENKDKKFRKTMTGHGKRRSHLRGA